MTLTAKLTFNSDKDLMSVFRDAQNVVETPNPDTHPPIVSSFEISNQSCIGAKALMWARQIKPNQYSVYFDVPYSSNTSLPQLAKKLVYKLGIATWEYSEDIDNIVYLDSFPDN